MSLNKTSLALVLNTSLCVLVPLSVFAQPVEVVEGQPDVIKESSISRQYKVGQYNAAEAASNNGELFVTIQQLQDEVRELRGMVEEQSYLIEQLRQRRLDDYIDLDKRISDLQQGAAAPAKMHHSSNPVRTVNVTERRSEKAAVNASVPTRSPAVSKPPVAAVADTAKVAYRSAYQKIKDSQFKEAKVALTTFVSDFPESQYVPNAEFWLGELYYQDSELKKARDAFYILVTQYSNHRKVADAKYKLGKIYNELGDKERARLMLKSVLSDHPNSKAAEPARQYLKNSLG